MPIMSRDELLQPEYCLLATVFVNNAGLHCWYPHNTCVILLSQLVWVKGLKPPVFLNAERHFQNCGKANARRFWVAVLWNRCSSDTTESHHFRMHATTFSHFFFFFGCASTLKDLINHAPREVTVNEVPTVADKMKLEHWFPWVLLKCPSGRAPGFYKTPIVQTRSPQSPSTPTAGPIKATLDINYITASLKGITHTVCWGFTSTSRL